MSTNACRKAILTAGTLIGAVGIATADVGEIVRVAAPIEQKCINLMTDEITMGLRKVITQKDNGFITTTKKAGVSVIARLNAEGGDAPASHPSVTVMDVEDAPKGQMRLPLEYPLASHLRLAQGDKKTQSINLDIYIDKVRGANTFGQALNVAGDLLKKLPIPASPYTNAANVVFKYASDAITKESEDQGGRLIASVTLQFQNRPEPDIDKCVTAGYEATGAIAIIGPKAATSAAPIALGNLNNKYCFRYNAASSYEVRYAAKGPAACSTMADGAFQEVPNDYLMILLSAQPVVAEQAFQALVAPAPPLSARDTHLFKAVEEAAKLCDAMKVAPELCGLR